MGRGLSSGGGSSSLGYLFESNEPPKPAEAPRASTVQHQPPPVQNQPPAGLSRNNAPATATAVSSKPEDGGASAETGAPILGRNNNNYHRAEGQNTGNFITDRPTTKVHAAPGGGSSLGYLFGDGKKN
ncbi:hypothetical protein O6H91_18G038000 [Diphasiastrum complanatum]|uniref:Uncharacterized protein n=2 Tax=Diphasiastrum complanatum TaxID=34168 RepID=A0ACC2AZW1_DIPCM|nr:hypothetical protein O6H91_18G038000 [Diphasiastrum complanatum]KAJ7523109.1 hypothetical protein O6H91_18G038000 [Diphasiastrum complanatum]